MKRSCILKEAILTDKEEQDYKIILKFYLMIF